VAVDGSHLYWADGADANGDAHTGTINEAGLDGSNPTSLVSGQDYPIGVAVSSS
jgi:hypothetical protein